MRTIFRAGLAAVASMVAVAGLAACGTVPTSDQGASGAATVTVTAGGAAPTTVTMRQDVTVTSTAAPTAPAGVLPCTTADLKVALGEPGGAAGSIYLPIEFKNTGKQPCTLQGFPVVAYLTAKDGTQVGGAAEPDGDAGSMVLVNPGKQVSAQLQEVDVQNFDEADCSPIAIAGIRVTLPGAGDTVDDTNSVFLPQEGLDGCQAAPLPGGQFQLSVQAIVAS